MINVGYIVTSPPFAQKYIVMRRYGKWVSGRFVTYEPVRLNFYGSVQPATNEALQQFPEGDRQKGTMKFYCKAPKTFYTTDEDPATNSGNVSDEIIYNGQRYKIFAIKDWSAHGYMEAFAYGVGSV